MKRLTQEREARGWSRAELARRSGLHPTQVGQFEAGRLLPYDSQLEKLAGALGLPTSEAKSLLNEGPANEQPTAN